MGTTLEAAEVTTSYRPNGQVETLLDAENNKTTYEYDGHDRPAKTYYPSATKGANASNSLDYEQQGYDAASNVTSFRNRANETLFFSYDNLNRLTLKNLPGAEPDVSYGYDLLGRMKSASQTGHALAFTYDALGRKLTEAGPHGTATSVWDLAGRRTRLTYPDGFAAGYAYLTTGETAEINEPGIFGSTTLISLGYDALGRRASITRANGTSTSYSYDPVSRLSQLVQNVAGTTQDLTLGFSYNPAGQITSNTRSNDLYAWTGHGSGTTASPANGLNQLASFGGTTLTHDAKGNLTKDPHTGYTLGYSSENLLTTVGGAGWTGTLGYDPLMRLYEAGVNSKTRFVYDGMDRIAEYSSSGAQTARFVHGPGIDEPLIEYGGSGLASRTFLHADERGTIVAASNDSGTVAAFGKYDEYGKPQDFASRFGFAGKPYESMTELYDSRARMYNPWLPRFMQPDPLGYGDGMNQYPYAGGDPVNFVDPFGLKADSCLWINGCYLLGGHWEYSKNPVPTQTDDSGGVIVNANRRWVHDTVNASQLRSLFDRGLEPGWSLGGAAPGEWPKEGSEEKKQPRCTSAPVPPASRKYPVPKGYQSSGYPGNVYVRNAQGRLVNNPLYKARAAAGGVNIRGVLIDLGIISGGVLRSLLGGPIGNTIPFDVDDAVRAGALVAGSAVQTGGAVQCQQ